MPIAMALLDIVGGGLGIYLGVKDLMAAKDDLDVGSGVTSIVSSTVSLGMGVAETAALFSVRIAAGLAVASPFGWAFVAVTGIASFIINAIRSHKEMNRQRDDYRNVVNNIFKDEVNRSDMTKPNWS
jgi:hypothetical protein